jgi:hypothetical protein
MADRKVIPRDELHHQSKLTHPSQKHPVYLVLNKSSLDTVPLFILIINYIIGMDWSISLKGDPELSQGYWEKKKYKRINNNT